jgi:TrmH family RNA methyltransferase
VGIYTYVIILVMKNWRKNIYFTLVEPYEPGNVGSAARAIKNMDFKNLCLVNPPPLQSMELKKFAHNSLDILKAAEVHDSVHSAISDKHYVVGTSRRKGRRRGVFLPIDEGARRISEIAKTQKVSILFGREDRGLFNEEIEECAFLMTVPVNRDHPSLNLAQAVMIFALLAATPPKMAQQGDLVYLYERLENALRLIDYIPPDNKVLRRQIMQNMKHCLGRAGLTEWEFSMFHSICKHIEQKCRSAEVQK